MSLALATDEAKEDRDFDLTRVTGPLLIHLIGREMRHPRFFLWRCKAGLPAFKRRIERTFPQFPHELVDLAAMPLHVYISLKERIGQGKAFEIMRVAILTGGIAKWSLQYRTVDVPRTFDNLCDEELRVNQTGITKWNTMRVIDRRKDRFEIAITRCLYHELATALGVPELTPIVCQIDNAAFNSYSPDVVTFDRGGPGHRIADGAEECRFVFQAKGRSS